MRKTIAVSVATFVLGIVIGAALTVRAQAPQKFTIVTTTDGHAVSTTRPEPVVIKSDDLALRVTGRDGKRVIGTLVARVDGKWVEVEMAPQDSFASHR